MGNYAQIRISERFCKFIKSYKYNMGFSEGQPEHFLKPGKSRVNSLSTVPCFLHTSCQCQHQQPSPQRSYLYKPPPAQLVSLLDFPACFWNTVLQFLKCQIWDGISTFHAHFYCITANSTWFLISLQANFSPCSLSCVPSAISVCYFLEGRQPSKEKYFRIFLLIPPFASICYQNLFSKHSSCSWKILGII